VPRVRLREKENEELLDEVARVLAVSAVPEERLEAAGEVERLRDRIVRLGLLVDHRGGDHPTRKCLVEAVRDGPAPQKPMDPLAGTPPLGVTRLFFVSPVLLSIVVTTAEAVPLPRAVTTH